MKRFLQIVLLAPALMMTSVSGSRGQDFYEQRLRAGEMAYTARVKSTDAIDNLRIAAFGFLDRPPLLSEALVWLALSQNAAGRGTDVDATLARFLEVEQRFAPYAKLNLDPTIRVEFQALLSRRVSPSTLQLMPGLVGIVESEDQKIAKLPPAERLKALEAGAKREPGNVRWPIALARDAEARDNRSGVIKWAGRALEIEPANASALALRAHALAGKGECKPALADLDSLGAPALGQPALQADRFVCLCELGDWRGAEEAAKRLSPDQKARPDVAAAERKLAAQKTPQ